ncbi:type II secretion system F family protein [Candidatus Micrarchaeota archaeon]|nr:type II secretion system F family protein [Candidatus Micrarchaeota archaeon]
MIEDLLKQVCVLDFSGFFSESAKKRMAKELVQAGLELSEKEYLSSALLLSAFVSLLLFIPAFYFLDSFLSAASVFFVSLCFLMLFFLKYPVYLKKKRAEKIEAELAVALRAVSIELAFLPFEKVLKEAFSGFPELSKEFKRLLEEVEGGDGIGAALNGFTARVDSLFVRRAVTQLIFFYHTGTGEEGLRKLSAEIVSRHRTKSKEYGSKLAFFGMVFIAVSCIMPALFSAYVIVGSSFMEVTFSPNQILLLFLLVFPLLDSVILFYLAEKKPVTLISTFIE